MFAQVNLCSVIYKPAEAQDLLRRYVELVELWAPRTDLVSPGDLGRFTERHIDDSLRLLDLLAEAAPGPAIDVGSGAGLPGIPLAVADPSRLWRLLEPRRKRAAFLEEVVRELALTNVGVIARTAQAAAADPALRAAHSLAVARALAPPPAAIDLLVPLVAPGGFAVVMIGDADLPPNSTMWREGIAKVSVPPLQMGKNDS